MRRNALVALLALSVVSAVACSSPDGDTTGASSDSLTDGHAWKVLNVHYEPQTNGYWCGPTATKIALSARMSPPSQGALATQLHTTTNGTDSIDQVTGVLNANLGGGPYVTTLMPNDPPTPDQRARFWDDIVRSVDQNYPVVANIVAPPDNHPPGYPNTTIFHYFTVIGYNPDTHEAYIADPADFGGHSQYWLSFDQLATLVPPKGYSAIKGGVRCPGATGVAGGAIEVQYEALGGCGSILGVPLTNELTTPDTIGRYTVFEHGSIYWTPNTGAHEVLGAIRDKWKELGWEAGALGYPISGETDVAGGRASEFEHGSLTWKRDTGAVTVTMKP